jgi:hypothetical protein
MNAKTKSKMSKIIQHTINDAHARETGGIHGWMGSPRLKRALLFRTGRTRPGRPPLTRALSEKGLLIGTDKTKTRRD